MDISTFVDNYSEADRPRIEFAWNQKHTPDFVDSNQEFRTAVVAHCVAHPSSATLPLLEHVFLAEAAWAREAWGSPILFPALARTLLERGGPGVLDTFSIGFLTSFDTFGACHELELPSPLMARLMIAARFKAESSTESDARSRFGAVVELLEKISKGTAMQGWHTIEPGTAVSNVRIVRPAWYSRLVSWLRSDSSR
jgi:hypothetical protein